MPSIKGIMKSTSFEPIKYDLANIVKTCGWKKIKKDELKFSYTGDMYCLVFADDAGVFGNSGILEKDDTPEKIIARSLQEMTRLNASPQRLRLYFGINVEADNIIHRECIKASNNPETIYSIDASLTSEKHL